jgi:hypothetical protein
VCHRSSERASPVPYDLTSHSLFSFCNKHLSISSAFELKTVNQLAVGSIPTAGANKYLSILDIFFFLLVVCSPFLEIVWGVCSTAGHVFVRPLDVGLQY